MEAFLVVLIALALLAVGGGAVLGAAYLLRLATPDPAGPTH